MAYEVIDHKYSVVATSPWRNGSERFLGFDFTVAYYYATQPQPWTLTPPISVRSLSSRNESSVIAC